MNGKYLYFAIAAFLSLLGALIKFLPFFLLWISFLYFLSKYKQFKKKQILLVIIASLIFWLIGQNSVLKNKTAIPPTSTNFLLQFKQDPKIDGDLLQIQANEKQSKESLLIRYRIKSEEEKRYLERNSFYGCFCRVSGTLKAPSIEKNPNSFNYRDYLTTKNIYWIVEIQNNPLQNCTSQKLSPVTKIKQLRFMGIQYLETHFPKEMAALSSALIFGDRSLLDAELIGNYQKTGIVHLLAISGLHVSLVIGMVFYLGLRVGLTRQFMMNFLLILLPVYCLVAGCSPSVIRASLMIFLVLLSKKWKSQLKLMPIDSISLAFLLIIFFTPKVIFDVGFQLSFSVSLAIILSAPFILRRFHGTFSRVLATSVIAQLAATPLLLYHFFELSLIGILANLFYIPLFSFIYLPGLYLLFIIQFLFGFTPQILIAAFLKIIGLSNLLIGALANLSITQFIPGRPSFFHLIMYMLLIYVIFTIWEAGPYRKRNLHLLLLFGILFTFQHVWNCSKPYGEVTMIDVGQGDSMLIQFPHGKGNYLIDTGGTFSFGEEAWRQRRKPYEVGRNVVIPYLKSKGITKIDKLILTHGDIDHMGGAFSIIEELEVKQILLPSVTVQSENEIKLMKAAAKNGIPVIKVSAGDHWQGVWSEFYVLSPEKDFSGERNSGSITIWAQIGGVTWFFGGDLDQDGETKIIKQYPKLTIDVLKAGHHGSKTSSAEAFLNQIKPSVALISVGEGNRYGHPHLEVLNRLREINTTIYRTDQQGAITFRFYRNKGTFSTYLP